MIKEEKSFEKFIRKTFHKIYEKLEKEFDDIKKFNEEKLYKRVFELINKEGFVFLNEIEKHEFKSWHGATEINSLNEFMFKPKNLKEQKYCDIGENKIFLRISIVFHSSKYENFIIISSCDGKIWDKNCLMMNLDKDINEKFSQDFIKNIKNIWDDFNEKDGREWDLISSTNGFYKALEITCLENNISFCTPFYWETSEDFDDKLIKKVISFLKI